MNINNETKSDYYHVFIYVILILMIVLRILGIPLTVQYISIIVGILIFFNLYIKNNSGEKDNYFIIFYFFKIFYYSYRTIIISVLLCLLSLFLSIDASIYYGSV